MNKEKTYSPKEIAAFEGLFSIAKNGRSFSDIKVQDIATAAGIGKGTLYEYFSSKEDILSGSIVYALNTMTDRFDAIVSQVTTFRACLEGIFDELNHNEKLPLAVISSMVCSMSSEQYSVVKERSRAYHILHTTGRMKQTLANILAIGRRTGEIDETLSDRFCEYTLMSAIFGQTTANLFANGAQMKPVERDIVVMMVYRALRP